MPATGRTRRSATPTFPAVARVHHPWTCRRRNRQHPDPAPAGLTAAAPLWRPVPPPARREAEPGDEAPHDREVPGPQPARAPTAGRRAAVPKITAAVIAEGRYELVKAPDHAETRAWHVLVGGKRADRKSVV